MRMEIINEARAATIKAQKTLRINAALGGDWIKLTSTNETAEMGEVRQFMIRYIRGEFDNDPAGLQARLQEIEASYGGDFQWSDALGGSRSNPFVMTNILREAQILKSAMTIAESKKNNGYASAQAFAEALLEHKKEFGEYPSEIIEIYGNPDTDMATFNARFDDPEANLLVNNFSIKLNNNLLKNKNLKLVRINNLERAGTSTIQKASNTIKNSIELYIAKYGWRGMLGYSASTSIVAAIA